MGFPCRCLAVDGVVVDNGKVLLVRRSREPFKGHWALPGGFVERNEDIWQALVRELREETGCRVEPLFVVGIFSSPSRDPRGVVSVAIAARPLSCSPSPSPEVEEVAWVPLEELSSLPLAFDHAEILERYKALVGEGGGLHQH